MIKYLSIGAWALIVMSPAYALNAHDIPENCTAFLTRKDAFFSKNIEVSGTNCSQKITIEERKGLVRITVEIPSDRFKTGNGKRDSIIPELLGKSMKYTVEVSREKFRNLPEEFPLAGSLSILSRETSVTFLVKRTGSTLSGQYTGKLSELGIVPPKAGPGNIIAETHDFVTLIFRIKLEKIMQ